MSVEEGSDFSMTELKPISIEEFMALPIEQVIRRCKAWMDEFNDGEFIKSGKDCLCPVHAWVGYNHKKCINDNVPLIAYCPICGEAMCPECMNHNVEQLSRVTGYMSNVSGWNAAKKQELRDRARTDLKS